MTLLAVGFRPDVLMGLVLPPSQVFPPWVFKASSEQAKSGICSCLVSEGPRNGVKLVGFM